METNETFESTAPAQGIILGPEAQHYLRYAGKWANFLAIVGFIFCGFLLIFSLFAGTFFGRMAEFSPTPNPVASAMAGMGAGITIIYILIDLWYFFFCLYLFQFASKIKSGILFSDSTQVTQGLEKLKSFFKLWGISTIVIMSLYILAIIIAIIVGVSMLHQ